MNKESGETVPDGRALLVSGSVPNLSQLYDPATGTFSFGPHLVSQSGHAAYSTTLLSDGSVLVVVDGSTYAELYK